MTMTVSSTSFADGGDLPRRHTCDGEDLSPPLSFSGAPEGTREIALLVEDPDAPSDTFVHWVAWGIDPSTGALAEGATAPGNGRNGFGRPGYGGPCPPKGPGPSVHLQGVRGVPEARAGIRSVGRRPARGDARVGARRGQPHRTVRPLLIRPRNRSTDRRHSLSVHYGRGGSGSRPSRMACLPRSHDGGVEVQGVVMSSGAGWNGRTPTVDAVPGVSQGGTAS